MTEPVRFHPKYIYWELCNYCNLRCLHCFAKAGPRNTEGADKDVLAEKIREIERREPNPVPIRFGGGEPLMWPGLFDVLGECRRLGVPVSMTTNGTLLTDEKAVRLGDAGLRSLTVSIDGTEEYHEFLRGRGTFEAARRGLEAALRAGLDTSLSFTVTAWNHGNLADYIGYFHGLGVDRFYLFRYAAPPGGGPTGRFELDAGMLLEVARGIARIKKAFPDVVLVYEKAGFLDFILSGGCSRVSCNFVNGTVTIQHDGSVVVCAAVQKSLGNIYRDGLEDIWKNVSAEIGAMREPCRECQACPLLAVCNGGCRYSSYKKDGTYLHADACCYKGLC